jgi:pimeloyl-ACP methyl ester carboxylesterase
MGGYVALYLAMTKPELIESIVTLGTKLSWNEEIAAKEVAMLQPLVVEQKVPKFASHLSQLHAPTNWKDLMTSTGVMLTKMGAENPILFEDFKQIASKVLLMIGDRDKMVSLDETVAVFKQLPSAQLAVLPGTPHPIEQVDAGMVVEMIKRFIS